MKKLFIACLILVSSATVITSCKSGETKTAYQCPMKCEGEKTYDKPGECPLCKMELKEVK
jgi:protein SCO1